MVIQARRRTIEEFEEFINLLENADRRFELIDGEIVEKMPTEEHGLSTSNLHGWLFIYLNQNKIGRLVVEARYRVPEDDHNSRLPDISFTRTERIQPLVKKGAVPQMPDLAIEIKSPSDTYTGMREKARYYLDNGVLIVWLVFPEKSMIEVYQQGKDIQILLEHETLEGGDLLPGFSLLVKNIFAE